MTQTITMDEVVANAATIIPGEDREVRNLARQWAFLGARELNFNKLDLETETIIPTNRLVMKPAYHVRTEDMSFFDANDKELIYRFEAGKKDRIHSANIYKDRRNADYPIITVSEQQDAYVLDSYYGDDVATAIIRYYRLPVDSTTLEPYFYSEQLLALMMFIRWMWFLRKGDMGQAGQAKKDWIIERHAAKVDMKMPDGMERKEIARTWNSMIQKNFYNMF